MKNWMNTIFFGSCFIAAILIEAYSIQIMEGNLFLAVTLGIVVLITGYLFMDSIRSRLQHSSEGAKFYMDRVLNEESEKWNERHTEIMNLQKASYTATKKSAALQTEHFEELLNRLEALENNNAKTLQRIIDLQKKSLEGQKKALNLEVNYYKENTKHMLDILREEMKDKDTKEQLAKIITLLENNNTILMEKINHIEAAENQIENAEEESVQGFTEDTGFMDNSIFTEDVFEIGNSNNFREDFYEKFATTDLNNNEATTEKNTSEADWSVQEEAEPEVVNQVDETVSSDKTIIPLYDDPNKALTTDEIAALFASFGN